MNPTAAGLLNPVLEEEKRGGKEGGKGGKGEPTNAGHPRGVLHLMPEAPTAPTEAHRSTRNIHRNDHGEHITCGADALEAAAGVLANIGAVTHWGTGARQCD